MKKLIALFKDKQIFAWALYDWANSAYATIVMASFFQLLFKSYYNEGASPTESTYHFGIISTISGCLVALMVPLLSAFADDKGYTKKFLVFFTFLSVIATSILAFVPAGEWLVAAIVYSLSIVCFHSALSFYDTMLPAVAKDKSQDLISCFGYGLGYLGGGLLFLVCILFVQNSSRFGITPNDAMLVSFVIVAVWWLLFSLPLIKNAPIIPPQKPDTPFSAKATLLSLWETICEIVRIRNILIFLLAYWIYIDGVNTVIKMAVDYGASLGLDAKDLTMALLITQFIGLPSALIFAWIGEKVGAKKAISLGVLLYLGVTLFAYKMSSGRDFYILASVIGLVQGGVQALSRSMFSEMLPAKDTAKFFGIFNLLGKFAAIWGPLAVAFATKLSGSSRVGILPLAGFFIVGLVLLQFVKVERNSNNL